MIYATRYANNGAIAENATIVTFDSRGAAKAWLLSGHSDGLYPRISVGRFAGYWRRTDTPGPIEVAAACKPFQPDDLDTKDPDELGVNYFAHTPKPDVLVLVDNDSE